MVKRIVDFYQDENLVASYTIHRPGFLGERLPLSADADFVAEAKRLLIKSGTNAHTFADLRVEVSRLDARAQSGV